MRRAFVVSVIAVLALAACGSGTKQAASKVSTLDLVAGSPAAAEAAGTAHFSGTISMSGDGESFAIPMSGDLDFQAPAFSMTIDMSDLPGGPDGAGQMEARLVDGVMYMKMGTLLGGLSGGGNWVALSVDDLEGSAGLGATQNPADMMKGLGEAGAVKTLGPERIDGAETTHYRAEVQTGDVIGNLSGDLKQSAKRFRDSMPATIPLDVWIDENGLPRRFVMALEMGNLASMSVKLDFMNYGAPVSIEAPPADDTTSMDDLKSLGAV